VARRAMTSETPEALALLRIGIDVGGTNTDAVVLRHGAVAARCKVATTANVTGGIVTALKNLSRQLKFSPDAVQTIVLGTTHFINALVEMEGLAPTAAVRLGLPATAALPPMVGWPDDLRDAIHGTSYLCHGGNDFDGRVISELDQTELLHALDDIRAREIRSVAISSVFSPAQPEMEEEVAALFLDRAPDLHVTLSHEIGRMGLLQRENAAIINACLRDVARRICADLEQTLRLLGYAAELYISRNDGTVMRLEMAAEMPVATFASGPTNSMRGAAFLAEVADCAVVDVGGTTTDVGMLVGGIPREATGDVRILGIPTNFKMPDVLSVGIGGGSRVDLGGPSVTIGPASVGYRLSAEALIYGGTTMTATDLAVAAGRAQVGDPSLVRHLDPGLVKAGLASIAARVAETVDRMRTSPQELPVVYVGGGSILLPDRLEGQGPTIRPDDFDVANAVGAAICKVGGEVDRVVSMSARGRGGVLDAARQEAIDRALAAGARPGTVEIVEIDEIPITYLPGDASRIRVRAVGELDVERSVVAAGNGA
jgi:N-methylhydantoinase A/oxoprolinase/acetone carboxylase beta subunit